MSSNLPPGCSSNDIPGNRPEDQEYEFALDQAMGILSDDGDLTPEEIIAAAKMGLAAIKAGREYVGSVRKASYNEGCVDTREEDFHNNLD